MAQVKRLARLALAGLVLAGAGFPDLAAASRAPAPRVARRPAAVAPRGRPDAALYLEAQRAQATLRASPRRLGRRAEWEKVAAAYRRVVDRYPRSGYCDDALLASGSLHREMASRFSSARDRDEATRDLRMLVAEYPSSRHAEAALYAVFELARESGEERRLGEAVRRYLDLYPRTRRAAVVREELRRKAPVEEAALPRPAPPGLARVFNLRFWSGESSTRVVVDVERAVKLQYDRIRDPDRLWIDFLGARLHPNLVGRTFPVGDGQLAQIRLGQNREDVVRIVLDFKQARDHSVFYLQEPTRLVIDVRAAAPPVQVAARPPLLPPSLAPSPGPSPPPTPTPTPVARAAVEPFDMASEPVDTSPRPLPPRRLPGLAAPAPAPTPVPWERAREPVELRSPEGPPRRADAVPPPAPPSPAATADRGTVPEALPSAAPAANRAGSFSLARQLGLGARRIVIDAGHGGHDPGTIGRRGLQEKDLVLDVARRLARLVSAELGSEVILTRDDDTFIPLEDRTAIANTKGADLFLSVHANSSRNRRVRGVETYFLNFAQDPHAEEVAARENMVSDRTMKDLGNLVRAITLNSKIDESRDFAAAVQESVVDGLRAQLPQHPSRGTRTAPFVVLIGANMPSVLCEIAFVSHPEEELLLRSGEHRERIARGLLEGLKRYLTTLNRSPLRQLTASRPGATVDSRENRR